MSKVKVVLDADVIIHFAKGEALSMLPNILPNYDFIILDKVYKEITRKDIKTKLDNQINLLKNISIIEYKPKGEEMIEFAKLSRDIGVGESACISYCRYNPNIVGSSNITEIKSICENYKIVYLTTLDFLSYAIKNGLMTTQNADEFIQLVRSLDSKLPNISMANYKCSVIV